MSGSHSCRDFAEAGVDYDGGEGGCRGRVGEALHEANFLVTSDILYRKPSLKSCSDAALVGSDHISWGCSGASRWVQVTPLAMLVQVGEVREGARRGASLASGCSDPARQLDRPTTPEGEAGGRDWGSGAVSTLAHCDPLTPWWGEGWCWAGGGGGRTGLWEWCHVNTSAPWPLDPSVGGGVVLGLVLRTFHTTLAPR